MNKCNCEVRYRTIYCSKDCYKREVKKFIWNYQFGVVKREFISLMKHFGKFLYLIYKYYLQDVVNFLLGFSILLVVYFILNGLIWAVETYIN